MVPMSTRTFNSAVRGFHYYRRYCSPIIEERLLWFLEKNNAFVAFAIKSCKEDGTIVGHLPHVLPRTLKFILDRGASISAVFTFTHYRRLPLIKGSVEILCKG